MAVLVCGAESRWKEVETEKGWVWKPESTYFVDGTVLWITSWPMAQTIGVDERIPRMDDLPIKHLSKPSELWL